MSQYDKHSKKNVSQKYLCVKNTYLSNLFVLSEHRMYRVVQRKRSLFFNLDCLCFIFAQNVQGGSEIVGQLGHGNTSAYKAPKKVEELEDVIQVSCGEDFTFCVSGQLTCS